jgi:hypothetical protein
MRVFAQRYRANGSFQLNIDAHRGCYERGMQLSRMVER